MKQSEIQSSIGIERTTWSNYERGKSFPQLELFHNIAKYFGVNEHDLLNTDLSKHSLFEKKSETKEGNKYSLNHSLTGSLTVEPDRKYPENADLGYPAPNVYDFTSPAAAGTAIVLLDKDKYRSQPNLYLPGLGPGVHIRVPIEGDSMHSTVKDGDKAVATLVSERQHLHEGYIHILVDREDGLLCKRVYFPGHNKVELVSDNQVYKAYQRDLKDILWFKVRVVHTTDLRPYWNDLRTEMRQIWDEISLIRKSISK